MNKIDSIPAKRLFLPDLVSLQSDVCGCHASLLTSDSDGRAHDERVEELYAPLSSSEVPFMLLDWEAEELVALEPCRTLAKGLRARRFAREGREPAFALPIQDDTLVETLAWDALGDAGRRPRPRLLAWDVDDPAFGDEKDGDWATRLLHDADGPRNDLRMAIDMSDERAMHLTPKPDGSLRARLESTDYELAQYDGCGVLVVKKEDWRLRVYMPSRDGITWGLQRALRDAWAEEMFGGGTPWHWGRAITVRACRAGKAVGASGRWQLETAADSEPQTPPSSCTFSKAPPADTGLHPCREAFRKYLEGPAGQPRHLRAARGQGDRVNPRQPHRVRQGGREAG